MRLNKGDIVKAGHAHMRRPMRGVEGPIIPDSYSSIS